MVLITDEYRKMNEDLHNTNKNYGTVGKGYFEYIMEVIQNMRTEDVLDYGCGKGTLANYIPFKIKQYDPCIPKHSAPPEPADLVVCTDVLEHIEPDCLDAVLDDIQRLAKRAAFLTIANGNAKKTLSDGRNAHLIQESEGWWLPKIVKRFKLTSFSLFENPDPKEQETFEEYIMIVRKPSHERT